MSIKFLVIGYRPYGENRISREEECWLLIKQLRRQFGYEPVQTRLAVRHEEKEIVVCYYNDQIVDSCMYALKVQSFGMSHN